MSCGAPSPIPWENLIMGLPQLRRGRREEEEGSEEGKICSAWALCHTSGRETEARGAQRPWLGQIPAAAMDKGGPIRVLLLPLSLALVIGEGGRRETGGLGRARGHGTATGTAGLGTLAGTHPPRGLAACASAVAQR